MAYEIRMPQLSDSMEVGKLISWKVKSGEEVKTGDVIAEVESDKAIMEVQSFKNGVVSELLVEEGAEVPVGMVIARIDTESREEVINKSEERAEELVEDERIVNKASEHVSRHAELDSASHDTTTNPKEILNQVQDDDNATLNDELLVSLVSGAASPKAKAVASRYGIDIETLQASGKLPTPAHEDDVEAVIQKRYFTPRRGGYCKPTISLPIFSGLIESKERWIYGSILKNITFRFPSLSQPTEKRSLLPSPRQQQSLCTISMTASMQRFYISMRTKPIL